LGGKIPGLVLVAGSGPTDRDGNQEPALHTDLLKQIARGLGESGIATLRYDKRGVGASPLTPKNKAELAKSCAWENFAGDAVAAFRTLQKQPEIDPARTGMLGHSEGGLLVLEAASWMKAAPTPCVLVLISTPGRTIDAVVHDQLVRTLKLQGATPQQTRFFLNKDAAIAKAIRATGIVPDGVPAGLAALYPPYLGKFYKSELSVSPTKLAARFPGPVLVVQGARDVQVSPTQDAPALDAALKGRKKDNHMLLVAPTASHNLKTVHGPTDPGFTGPVDMDVLLKLCAWAKEKLARP
jgi:alpha-beta hydrolase superfamily lysophospholipase